MGTPIPKSVGHDPQTPGLMPMVQGQQKETKKSLTCLTASDVNVMLRMKLKKSSDRIFEMHSLQSSYL